MMGERKVVVIRQIIGGSGVNISKVLTHVFGAMFERLDSSGTFELHPFVSLQETLEVGADIVVTNLGSTKSAAGRTVALVEKLVSKGVVVVVESCRPYLLEKYGYTLPESVGSIIKSGYDAEGLLRILRDKLGM